MQMYTTSLPAFQAYYWPTSRAWDGPGTNATHTEIVSRNMHGLVPEEDALEALKFISCPHHPSSDCYHYCATIIEGWEKTSLLPTCPAISVGCRLYSGPQWAPVIAAA